MALLVGVPLGLWLGVALLLKELEPLLLPLAPELKELVRLADTVLLPLRVEEGVGAAEPVPVSVELPVDVPLELWLGVPLLLSEVLPEVEAEAPTVREAVETKKYTLRALVDSETVPGTLSSKLVQLIAPAAAPSQIL